MARQRRAVVKPREYNPLCLKFPAPSQQDIKEMADDIEAHGQQHGIQLDAAGRILDGRTRFLACTERMIQPVFVKWKGTASEERYREHVVSHNLIRRHQPLSPQQRAILLAEIYPPENKDVGRQKKGAMIAPFSTVADQARAADVSERTMQMARAVVREHPEAVPAIKAGQTTAAAVLAESAKKHDAAVARAAEESGHPTGFETDCFGNALPRRIQDAFAAVEKLVDWKNRLQAIRREILSACESGEAVAAFLVGYNTGTDGKGGSLQLLQTHIDNAAAAIRFAMPYCLCPSCGGDRCKLCLKQGWLPKQVYEQVVASELKWKVLA